MPVAKFTFTDVPPGSREIPIIEGIHYKIYDDKNNDIVTRYWPFGGLENLDPGQYCIRGFGSTGEPNTIWFGSLAFEVLDEYPPRPTNIWPPINYDVIFYVQVEKTEHYEIDPIPEISCDEMWPQENGSLLWLGVLLLLLLGGG